MRSIKLDFVSQNNQVQAYLNIWQNIFRLVLPTSYMDELSEQTKEGTPSIFLEGELIVNIQVQIDDYDRLTTSITNDIRTRLLDGYS